MTGAAIVAGTVVTGAGPHAGDEDVGRYDVPIADAARVHGTLVIVAVVLAAVLGIRLQRHAADRQVLQGVAVVVDLRRPAAGGDRLHPVLQRRPGPAGRTPRRRGDGAVGDDGVARAGHRGRRAGAARGRRADAGRYVRAMTATDASAPPSTDAPAPRDEVRYEVADHVATITLDAPERMNTISGPDARRRSPGRLLEADRDPRRALHRADRHRAGVLRRARPRRPGQDHERRARQPRHAVAAAPASSTCATRRRSCCTTSTRRRSAPSTAAPPATASTSRSAATSASPPRRPSSTPASPSAASCPRAAARGCCRGWSATPRRPSSPSGPAR